LQIVIANCHCKTLPNLTLQTNLASPFLTLQWAISQALTNIHFKIKLAIKNFPNFGKNGFGMAKVQSCLIRTFFLLPQMGFLFHILKFFLKISFCNEIKIKMDPAFSSFSFLGRK